MIRVALLGLVLGLLAFAGCERVDGCEYTGSCVAEAGAASGESGTSGGEGGAAGESSAGAGGEPSAGAGGEPGGAPASG